MHAPAQLLFGEQTEPALHQVQPGGTGGREMNMEAGPLGEPVPDQRRLVGGVVVGNQVHVQLGGHLGLYGIEKLAELQGPVAAVALANHLTGPGIQSGEEGRGAVAHVIMGAPLGLARTQGQKRPGAVQGLDLGLLVHAQDQRPVRRVEVEPHNIPHLLDEEGVRRQLEGLGAVGLQREGTPDAAHGVVAQTGTPGHGPGAPVCSILRCGLQGQRHDPLNVSIGDSAGSARPCFIHQSVQSTLQEPRPPLANRRLRHSQLCGHSGVRLALRTFQNHSGPLGQRLRRLGPARPLSQCLPFIVGERQRWGWSTKTHVNPPHMNCQEDTSYQTLIPLTSETRH